MGLPSYLLAWGLALTLGLGTLTAWLVIPHAPNPDPLVLGVLVFNLLMMVVAIGIELGRRPYSLHLMHLISLFLFLGAAALLQYASGSFGVAGPISGVRGQVLEASAVATLWMTGYVVAYEARRLLSAGRGRGFAWSFLARPIPNSRAFLLACLALAGLAYLAAVGLLGAVTRGAAETAMRDFSERARVGGFTSVLFIVNYNLMRALPLVALLACLMVRRRRSPGRSLVAALVPVLAVGTLLVSNPFAASRIYMIAAIFGFTVPFLLRRFRTGSVVLVSVLMGLAVLPALGAARHALDLGELRALDLALVSPLTYLATSSDVDSLGMTALCQTWVERYGHRWGLQILGALLFWVPRALWPSKPVATGTMVTGDLGFDFTNISPPLPAEALVDFGLTGVPVLGALFGLLLARLDGVYWAGGREALSGCSRVIDAIYPFWLICIVFLTRGDLFAALAFSVGFTLWILPLGLRWSLRANPLPGAEEPGPGRDLEVLRS